MTPITPNNDQSYTQDLPQIAPQATTLRELMNAVECGFDPREQKTLDSWKL
jgi:hypothetical protein